MAWTIPASKTKMRRDHCVPLSSKAVNIIEAIRPLTGTSPYLFPHMTDNQRPMSKIVLNNALRRLGFGKDETCAHDFRSTFSTLAREKVWAHHIIEAALAHVQGSTVAQAYVHCCSRASVSTSCPGGWHCPTCSPANARSDVFQASWLGTKWTG